MSNVLLESVAIGSGIITSNISSCREAIDNSTSGFLCDIQDEESLHEMMKTVAETLREQLRKYGVNRRYEM